MRDLAASVSGRAIRAGAIVVLGAGVAMLAVVSSDINHVTKEDNVIGRVGFGFWWSMVAGLLAVAGTILVVARTGPTADDLHEVSR